MNITCRPWNSRELRRLVDLSRAGHSTRECAALLGRSVASCGDHLRLRGIRQNRPRKSLKDYQARIRRLYQKGYTINAIGVILGLHRRTIYVWCQRLGLACRGVCQTSRDRMRAAYYRRLLAGKDLVAIRQEKAIERSAALGWPQVESPRQASILELLWTEPRSARELAVALGCGLKHGCFAGSRIYRHLHALRARGLVVKRGAQPALYELAPGVRPARPLGQERA